MTDLIAAWLAALDARHRASLRAPEFLKALRALSARYVERRATLATRSPIDSAGKRAAFAAFYAALHFLTTREVVRALGAGSAPVDLIVDLGCGTGVASAAWALEWPEPPRVRGVDTNSWAVDEAAWNWRQLGLHGQARRGDLVDAAESVLADSTASAEGYGESAEALRRRKVRPTTDRATRTRTGVVAAWSVNELAPDARARLLRSLLTFAAAGACVLVIEPLARGVTPWWDEWTAAFVTAGGRADEWKFDVALPPPLAETDDAAGFRREGLGGRSLWLDRR